MASANRAELNFVEEAEFGVNPGGEGQLVRMNSTSLQLEPISVQSEELRSDRGRARGKRLAGQVTGDIVGNFFPGDPSMENLLRMLAGQSAWPAAGEGKTGGAIAGGGVVTLNAHGFTAGQWVRLSGLDDEAANKWYRITAVDANTFTLANPPSNLTGSPVWKGSYLKGNGIEARSASFEVWLDDAQDSFEYRGVMIGSLALDLSPESIIVGTFGTLGSTHRHGEARTINPGTASTVAPIVTGEGGDVQGYIDDQDTGVVTSVSLNIDAGLRREPALWSPPRIALGTVSLTGSMEIFTDDFTRYDDFVNATARRLDVIFGTEDDWLALSISQADFTGATVLVEGIDTSALLRLDFEASVKGTEGVYGWTKG
ncbi:MAG: phage tail tube protein [Deltaproteobacteria bacterium]|nr:phage tail tube protein [Deltaproteobacteria bacterium]